MRFRIHAIALSVLAADCIVSSSAACPGDSTFECPDDQALRLFEIALNPYAAEYGFKDSIDAFSFVIENATRPMDEVALRGACFGLARDLYLDEYYGRHADIRPLLIPPEEAAESLRKKHPILGKCPDRSLYEAQLPIRRPTTRVLSEEAVRLGVTGWVDLELDVSDDGQVERARIVDSSNPVLEPGVVDYVLEFRYPASSHRGVPPMRRNGFQARVITDYFDIARARGCEWDDPREQ